MAHAQRDLGLYNHAHNDYLELAADTGLLGLGLLMLLVVGALVASIGILRHRRNATVRGAAFAALMAITCLALHSLVEFNLQIPAIAFLFTTLLALPFAAARGVASGRERRRSSKTSRATSDAATLPQAGETLHARTSANFGVAPAAEGAATASAGRGDQDTATIGSPPSGKGLRRALALLTTVALAWVGYTAVRFGVADYVGLRANAEMALWEQGDSPLSAPAVATVQESLNTAIALMPESAEFRETLGNTWFARALLPDVKASYEERTADMGRAADAYRAALARSPSSAYTWGNLMLAKGELGQFDEEFTNAMARAAALAPYEPTVQVMLVSAGLAGWNRLPEASRRIVAQTITRGWASNRDRLAGAARENDNSEFWCEPAPGQKPLVDSPPDVAIVMRGLCQVLASLPDRPQ